MKMKRVDEIKLQDVDEIDANLFTDSDLYGMILIMKGNPIDCVKIICVIEIHIDAVHHHDQFPIHRRTPLFWIYDERAVESFRNVTRKRENVTMIEVESKWLRVELIREITSRFDQSARTCARHTVHFAGVESVKVHRVRMIAPIAKVDSNTVSFRSSNCGAGNSSVICPRRKFNARYNFYIFVERNDLVFPQGLSMRQR